MTVKLRGVSMFLNYEEINVTYGIIQRGQMYFTIVATLYFSRNLFVFIFISKKISNNTIFLLSAEFLLAKIPFMAKKELIIREFFLNTSFIGIQVHVKVNLYVTVVWTSSFFLFFFMFFL